MFNPADPLALPQIQMDLARGRRDLQFADALMNAGYVPNSGALGAISQIAQAFMGRKLSRKADEKISDALKRQFEADNARTAQEAQRKAEEEDRSYRKAIERRAQEAQMMGLQGPAAQRYAVTGEIQEAPQVGFEERLFQSLPQNMQQQAALGKFGLLPKEQAPRAPSDIELRLQMAQQLGATPEQLQALVLGGGAQAKATPEERESAKLEATRLKEAEDRARAAQKTLDTVAKLESLMSEGISTGPLDQYLPGRNRQLFDALSSDLNLSTLRQNFGGNPTEGERAANAATLPGVGQYENNNRELLKKLRAQAEGILGEYQTLSGAPKAPASGGWSIQLVN